MTAPVVEVRAGLVGVVADVTEVSAVVSETNSLTYRGYAVQDLAAHASFEEVAYLLLYGELPNAAALHTFTASERALRPIPESVVEALRGVPAGAHPMDALRSGVSLLGTFDEAASVPGSTPTPDQALALLARIPTIIAAHYRLSAGQQPIEPSADLSIAANFMQMCFGTLPSDEVVLAFDVSLILYAEHGFNASTFTARVVTSTTSDIFSAVTAAIGALKGPLHGGANEAVMEMLDEIGTADAARPWLEKALADKRKIMGFGHRVYRNGDSRVPTMKRHLDQMAARTGDEGAALLCVYETLEQAMFEAKDIRPNVDYPSGAMYHLMGFPTNLFTPIFAMARLPGWSAHVFEQWQSNKLIRPLAKYEGPAERPVVPLADRG
jgi:citrate synthase